MARLSLRSIKAEATALGLEKVGHTAYYVDGTNGSDAYDGLTWETAFATIQHAVDESSSWAKIYVKVGTYVENVVIPVTKRSISLIGEDRDNVIIIPTSGNAVRSFAQNCHFENFTAIGNGAWDAGIDLHLRNSVKNCQVGNQDNATGCGLKTASLCICDQIRTHQTFGYRPGYGIHLRGNESGELKNCDIQYAKIGIKSMDMECKLWKVHDNLIQYASSYGIYFDGMGTMYNTIYHNNITNSVTANVYNGVGALYNEWVENYYDDHIVDTNNDGLCDTPYTFTTGTDYSPVSKRNGWIQESLGFSSGADGGGGLYGGKEIWESFEYPSDTTLRTRWIEGGTAGNPTRSLTSYWGQYSIQTIIGGGVGHIYRLLSARNMNPIANITVAARSNNAGDTFRFTLYDSSGNYSYWTQTLVGANTWYNFEINIHSVPTGSSATPVDLEDVVEIRMAEMVAGSTYLFDLITFEGLATEDLEDILDRVNQIFDLENAELILTETGGTITTDGTLQTLYINDAPAGVYEPKKIQLDFTAQTAAETLVLRESYRIKSTGNYIEKDAVTFTGVQSPLLKNITLEQNRFGTKVTLERTAGVAKDYDWEAIYKI